MSSLHQLQENFQNFILNNDAQVVDQITDIEQLTAEQRALIYKVDYELRLIEIIEHDFNYLKQYMGDEAFQALARDYIKAHPSNHFNIIFFNRFFTDFMTTYPDVGQVERDLATYEWQVRNVLIATDSPQLGIDDLAAIPPERWGDIQVTFHPSARTFTLMTNAHTIWQAYEKAKNDNASPELPQAEHYTEPMTWMMWRYNQLAYFISLTPQRAWMYEQMGGGKSFAEVCDGLLELMPEEEVAQFAGLSLRDWFMEGAISSVQLADSDSVE